MQQDIIDIITKEYVNSKMVTQVIVFKKAFLSFSRDNYATVFEASPDYAIKIFKKSDNLLPFFQNELYALSKFKTCKYVVNLIDSIKSTDGEYLGIVTDLKHEDLFSCVRENQYFDEKKLAKIMHQILSALNYIHNLNFVHRNINHGNVLISNAATNPLIHLTGFAFSTEINPQRPYCFGQLGTCEFWAPEIIRNEYYSYSVDIWAAGIIFFYCLTGRLPFNATNLNEMFAQILTLNIEKVINDVNISDDAKDLMIQMLNLDYHNRITASEALQHKWFRNSFNETEFYVKEKMISNYQFFNNNQFDDKNPETFGS